LADVCGTPKNQFRRQVGCRPEIIWKKFFVLVFPQNGLLFGERLVLKCMVEILRHQYQIPDLTYYFVCPSAPIDPALGMEVLDRQFVAICRKGVTLKSSNSR